MAVLSDITLLVEPPPPPKRETVTLDMSGARYAVLGAGTNRAVWAVFNLHSDAKAFIGWNSKCRLRIIDLTNGNDVTTER